MLGFLDGREDKAGKRLEISIFFRCVCVCSESPSQFKCISELPEVAALHSLAVSASPVWLKCLLLLLLLGALELHSR